MNDRNRPAKNINGSRNQRNGRPAPKARIDVFYLVIVLVGVLACVIVFAVLFNYFKTPKTGGSGNPVYAAPPPTASPQTSATAGVSAEPTELTVMTAVITSIDYDKNRAEFYDFNLGNSYIFNINDNSEFYDKYGQRILFTDFKAGDIVDAAFGSVGGDISSMKMSATAFTFKSISSVAVNYDAQTITIGGSSYQFTDKLVCVYNGAPADIKNVDPVDVVTVKGYGEYVWSVTVTQGHGTVNALKDDNIVGALIEIDNIIYKSFDSDISVAVPEGSHKAIIKGSNIKPYTVDFTINNGGVYNLDLTGVEYTYGFLTINVSEPGAAVTVNGTAVDITSAIKLNFGDYIISTSADGFITDEQTISFNEPKLELLITLLPEPTPAPAAQTENASPAPSPTEKPQYGSQTVLTDPTGAEIWVDGNYYGVAPATFSIEYGTHSLLVLKDGYSRFNSTIKIGEINQPMSITLQPLNTITTEDAAPGTPLPD